MSLCDPIFTPRRVSTIALTLAFLGVVVLPTHAGGFRFGWSQPSGLPGSGTAIDFACAVVDTQHTLHVAIQPNADVPDFRTLRFHLEIGTGVLAPASPLQPFWHFEDGGCNPGGFSIDPSLPPNATGYESPWNSGTLALAGFAPASDPSRGRFVIDVSRAASPLGVLRADRWYHAFSLRFALCDAPGCPGCGQEVLMVPGTVELIDDEGTIVLVTPTGTLDEQACVNTHGWCGITGLAKTHPSEASGNVPLRPASAVSGICEPVAVRQLTWGTLKIRYR